MVGGAVENQERHDQSSHRASSARLPRMTVPRVPPSTALPCKNSWPMSGRQDQRHAHFAIGRKGWQWMPEQDLWDNIGRLTLETSVLSIVLIHLISSEAKRPLRTQRLGFALLLTRCILQSIVRRFLPSLFKRVSNRLALASTCLFKP